MTIDTEAGGETLTLDEAAAAFAKSTSEDADNGQAEENIEDEGGEADDEVQASDEDEAEIEGDPDEDGQSDDEDDKEPDSDQGRFVASNGKVKLPDGTVSTVAALIEGNLKERDYRQKTMGLADERRAFEEQSSAFKASEKQVNEQREYLSKLMESITPQPPDPSMMAEDPIGYMQAKDQYERFVAHSQYLQQQMDLSRQQAEEETRKRQESKRQAEWGALQSKVPALRDQAKLKAFTDDIRSAAQSAGFSHDEIIQAVPYDHRMALVLQKAAKWDRLQANKPKVAERVRGRPPVQKSGKRLTPDAQRVRRAQDATNRLKETGSMDDAVAAYLASTKG